MTGLTVELNAALSDRYRIEHELGAGGMATVYLAQDLKHNRKVALKVLRPELAVLIGAERFLQEIEVTANLQHPHILPLFDSGEAVVPPLRTAERGSGGEAFLYYVMPYVEGETLRDKLDREKQLGLDEAVEISRNVAAALDYAHRRGVIHRDIKPENVLLHDGQPMVADFGIALAVSQAGGTRLTETGLSIGTPHYMSPEQAMGDRELDARSDVYSLGAVLYEMLTGEPPYTGSTAQAIVARVITEEPRDITLQRRMVPPHVAAAVHKALAKLPADRFVSAAEFSQALTDRSFVAAMPSTREVAAPVAAGDRARWRRPMMIAAAILVGFAGAAVLDAFLPTPPPEVRRQRVVFARHPHLTNPPALGMAVSPDGRTVVYADTAGGTARLWAKEGSALEAQPLAGTDDGVGPFFSPDGEWIAFVSRNTLKKVPRTGGSPITLSDSATSFFPAGAWLDDGTIVFSHTAWHLMRVSEAGGPTERLVETGDIDARNVLTAEGLPGGRGVLFTTCSGGCAASDLRVLDLETRETRILVDDGYDAWYVPTGHVVYARRDGGVFAAPFDLAALEFTSAPVPVFEGVRGTFGAFITLSPSGTIIYQEGPGADDVAGTNEPHWVTRDGRATPIDPGWAYTPAGNGGMSLSPDGTRLAVAIASDDGADIWVKQLDDGPLTRLTFDGNNFRPVWTLDGRSVLYMSHRDTGRGILLRKRADGSGREEVLLQFDRPIVEVVPSPDGEWLVLRYGAPPSLDILALRPGADSVPIPLMAEGSYDEVSPTLSPDGRWLAYASNESGRHEVYVRPFPDIAEGRWQVSSNGGVEPLWAPDGESLFYRAGSGMLMEADVTTRPAFALGDQRPLFASGDFAFSGNHRAYDVAPDGERFVLTRFAGADQGASGAVLVMIENWFTELERLVGN